MLGEISCPDLVAFFRVREQVDLDEEFLSLTASDIHLQSRPTVKCDDIDIFSCLDREQPCTEHEHDGELPIECLGPL